MKYEVDYSGRGLEEKKQESKPEIQGLVKVQKYRDKTDNPTRIRLRRTQKPKNARMPLPNPV